MLNCKEQIYFERQSESALRMADTVNSYTHYNVTGLAFALTFAPPVAVIHCSEEDEFIWLHIKYTILVIKQK